MGIRNPNSIPAFLPRDFNFRYRPIDPEADIPRLFELINEISAESERRVGLMKKSLTRSNYILNGWFRQVSSGVPLKWTSGGVGVTFSSQTERTGGMPDGNAARIAAGANPGTLTQVVNIGWGTKWSLSGWFKITTGSGQITITPNGTNPLISHISFSATNYGTGWIPFPSLKATFGHIELPTDATQITIELRADANSTIDFSEIQLGPGTVGYPDMFIKAPEDITEIVQIGSLPSGYGSSGQYLKTDGAGALSWDTPGGGIQATEFDAKGDILVGSADDAFNNLPVGSNGKILVADSGETLGIRWGDGPGYCNVGTTTDASASGDFAAGTASTNRIVYDQSSASIVMNDTNGQAMTVLKELTEELTIAAAASTDSSLTIPQDAIVYGVTVRVTTAIPGPASVFDVQNSVDMHSYSNGPNVAVAAGTTYKCTNGCPKVNNSGSAAVVRITPDFAPGAGTGKVRITLYYYDFTVPTS